MMRLLLRPAIALLTFSLSLALSWALKVEYNPLPDPDIVLAVNGCGEPEPKQGRRGYTSTTTYKLMTNGFFGSITDYVSSDGWSFTRTFYYYRTPRRANKELQVRIQKAEIVKREPVLDENGKRVGEKFIVKYRNSRAGMLWTKGPALGEVESPSIENLLQYERDMR